MKLEIDLTEILHDDYGDPAESMAESIRRQVVAAVAKAASDGIQRRIDAAVDQAISRALTKAVDEQLPSLIADLMDAEYRPVDPFGRRGDATTLRNALLKTMQEQMVYKRSSYDSDKNAFTRAVDGAVSAKLDEFRKEYHRVVDGPFVAEAMAYATEKLRERLGLPKTIADAKRT
jgi:hypothetical protein